MTTNRPSLRQLRKIELEWDLRAFKEVLPQDDDIEMLLNEIDGLNKDINELNEIIQKLKEQADE